MGNPTIRAAFSELDKDHDGFVTMADLSAFLSSMPAEEQKAYEGNMDEHGRITYRQFHTVVLSQLSESSRTTESAIAKLTSPMINALSTKDSEAPPAVAL